MKGAAKRKILNLEQHVCIWLQFKITTGRRKNNARKINTGKNIPYYAEFEIVIQGMEKCEEFFKKNLIFN